MFQEVGTAFVNQYYNAFSTNRASLRGCYRSSSLMTWAGEQLQGVDAIMNRLSSLQFNQAQFRMEEIDCHPSVSGGVLIVVNGEVILEGERHPLKFNDVFHLAQENREWFITNHFFRIVGGGGQ